MTAILLPLALSLLTAFLAGLRCGKVLSDRRRGGWVFPPSSETAVD